MQLTVAHCLQAFKQIAPIYILVGDEPLQQQECVDHIRKQAQLFGYTERQVYLVDNHFDWGTLQQAAASLSLFSQQRILELQLSKLPDKAAQKVLLNYVKAPASDVLLILHLPSVPYAKQKTAWFKTLEKHSQMVIIQEIKPAQLPKWLATRAKQRHKLEFESNALRCLAERSEGHLLAAAQELEKLKLFYDPEDKGVCLSEAHVISVIEDNARYQIFACLDLILAGQLKQVLKQLKHLQASGLAIVMIANLLTREIRLLNQLAWGKQQGQALSQLLPKHRVWRSREQIVKAALQRHSLIHWHQFLQRAHLLEQAIKGDKKALQINPWADLIHLAQDITNSAHS